MIYVLRKYKNLLLKIKRMLNCNKNKINHHPDNEIALKEIKEIRTEDKKEYKPLFSF